MEGNGNCGGQMSIGPWGGPSGKNWNYMAKSNAITQIIVIYSDNIIDSIMFKGGSEYSKRIAGESGRGGTRTDKVDIDFPSEFLTGISGFYELISPEAHYVVVKSLRFFTNRTEYGPFGSESGQPFAFHPKGGIITGFHGRSGWYIDAIGVYFKPVSSVFVSINPTEEYSEFTLMPNEAMNIAVSNTPGPWGGDYGREFDDGVFSEVKEVRVHLCNISNAISAVQFKYLKKDGDAIWSPLHGATGGDVVKKIIIDCGSEFLIGIDGFHGAIEGSCGIEVIKSLTFHTNKGKYGPFGSEIGKYFTSNVGCGKLVGFFGKSGSYLNAIGVHTEYL